MEIELVNIDCYNTTKSYVSFDFRKDDGFEAIKFINDLNIIKCPYLAVDDSNEILLTFKDAINYEIDKITNLKPKERFIDPFHSTSNNRVLLPRNCFID